MLDFPLKFENPLLGLVGIIFGAVFVLLFYFSYERLRIAEKHLEVVRWKALRRVVNATNVLTKIGVVLALSFLLAVPYLSTTMQVPIEELADEQLAQSGATMMLVLDVSYSMNNSDLKPTRLDVAKEIAKGFIGNVDPSDLIGFMSFAGNVCDVITPTVVRSEVLEEIENQTLQPSTALGTALESALGALSEYQGGKAIVLISDGKNNIGIMNLTLVAETALEMKIPIFTVFVGTYGIAEGDPLALSEISEVSGGSFYEIRGEDVKSLNVDVLTISHDVKVGALKTAHGTLSIEVRDFSLPLLFFAALLILSLFASWFTGV